MTYELWDTRSRNMIAYWKTAGDADAALTVFARQHGYDVLNDLFLIHEDDNEESTLVAEGQAMLVAIKRLAADEQATPASRRIG